MRIGIVGTGTIATAVVRGIAGDGHEITVSERSATNAAALARDFANVTIATNAEVVARSEVIFLGLPFRPDQKVISFMAGASLDEVATMISPASAAAIMMPFPAIARGGSAIMMLGDEALVASLFGARNQIFALASAADLEAYLCAQAVLSPVARMIDDAAGWLAGRVTDASKGEAFLRTLVASSLTDSHTADLIEALNTPGGYNQRLRLMLEQSGMRDALRDGLDNLETGS
ncbi:MAG: NAD(P)-binding domain-containing protein [Maritimibacter sp.]